MYEYRNHPLYRKHNIDSAMSSLWDFYRNNFAALFVMSIIMSLVIQYVSSLVNIREMSEVTDPLELLERMKALILPMLGVSLINLLATIILQYYVMFNPLDKTNSIPVSFLRSLKYFIPYLIILILLAFVGTIAIVLGILALIIGAFFAILYIVTLYLFILPIMMAEGVNIGSTISRTISLAHRNFWSNIGWVAVFIIIVLVVSIILSGLILLPFTGSFIKTILNPSDASKLTEISHKPLFIILSAAVGALTYPLMPIFSCILYFNGKAGEDMRAQTVSTETPPLRVEDLYAKPYSDDHPDNPEKNK